MVKRRKQPKPKKSQQRRKQAKPKNSHAEKLKADVEKLKAEVKRLRALNLETFGQLRKLVHAVDHSDRLNSAHTFVMDRWAEVRRLV